MELKLFLLLNLLDLLINKKIGRQKGKRNDKSKTRKEYKNTHFEKKQMRHEIN